MKKSITLLLIFLIIPIVLNAQGRRDHKGPREKIEQLEKIKLIEALDMDEQTTLKFFARRNEFRGKMDDLNDSLITIVESLDLKFSNKDESGYKDLVSKYLTLEKQIATLHSQFINSLYDILTNVQVAKLIVFEKKFRDEIRRILLKGRQPPPDDMR
jgi:hypothetical protein